MDAKAFLADEYDYVIVGGGTAGLVLAARLSEDASVKVAVLEAGTDHSAEPIVNTPALHVAAFGHPKLDWAFKTVPQKHAANKVHGIARGKGLGGSSAINFSMFAHASRRDLDNWAACGNDRWTFDTLAPYYRKFETFHPPSERITAELGVKYLSPQLRGTSGPVQISFSETEVGWLAQLWPKACQAAGYTSPQDPRGGTALGGYNQLTCADPATVTRSYAASAYLWPNRSRKNLAVLTEALVARIEWDGHRAAGVAFEHGGETHIVRARREVIVCAGAFQSPQLLEVSGIGSAARLAALGIALKADNPGVGENLQDHLMTVATFRAAPGVATGEALQDPAALQAALGAYAGSQSGPLAAFASPTAYVSLDEVVGHDEAEAQRIVALATAAVPGETPTAAAKMQRELAAAQLRAPGEAVVQNCPIAAGVDVTDASDTAAAFAHAAFPGVAGFSMGLAGERPFSRGSVHAVSPSMRDAPAIDPNYYSHPLDVEIAAASLLHNQKLALTEPLASKMVNDGKGGKEPLPGGMWLTSMDEAREYARRSCNTQWHPCSTCAMLPRDKGGVVDQSGRVYGVTGLRVCDASIFPMIPQGNIMSLVYAVAERIADDIKAGV